MTATETPDVIARYLQLAPKGDLDTLVTCFTSDAEVIDEGTRYHGPDEIRGWREAVAAEFTYTQAVLGTEAVGGDHYIVTSKLEGTFPGSPVELRYRFTLRASLISALEIAP